MVNLKKGQNVALDLTKTTNNILVGLGWDVKTDSTVKEDFDLDVVAIIVDKNTGKGLTPENVFFYNNVDGKGATSETMYASGKVEDIVKSIMTYSPVAISKDNRSGLGDGDDEILYVNPTLLGEDKKIIIAVNIYQADARKQVFGMVNNPYIRIVNSDGSEAIRYDLKEDFSIETGAIVAELYHNSGEFKIRALGTGFEGDLNKLLNTYQ